MTNVEALVEAIYAANDTQPGLAWHDLSPAELAAHLAAQGCIAVGALTDEQQLRLANVAPWYLRAALRRCATGEPQ